MKQTGVLERARKFIYENGRLLDRRRFEFFFEGAPKEHVWTALRAYQNADGGFGNALEPDIRCPYSQPVGAELALQVMDEVDGYDPDMLKDLVRYLRGIALDGGGFPLAHRSLMEYPHAPWWTVEQERNASMNPTGSVIGYLLKQRVWTEFADEEWFARTVDFCWRSIEGRQPADYHDGIHWIRFLEHAPDRSRAAELFPAIDRWLAMPGVIERDADAQGYVHKVLDWAPEPGRYAAKIASEEEIGDHLAALLRQQHADGGWPIGFPAASPAAELEWRGWLTVERLKTLQAYGRL